MTKFNQIQQITTRISSKNIKKRELENQLNLKFKEVVIDIYSFFKKYKWRSSFKNELNEIYQKLLQNHHIHLSEIENVLIQIHSEYNFLIKKTKDDIRVIEVNIKDKKYYQKLINMKKEYKERIDLLLSIKKTQDKKIKEQEETRQRTLLFKSKTKKEEEDQKLKNIKEAEILRHNNLVKEQKLEQRLKIEIEDIKSKNYAIEMRKLEDLALIEAEIKEQEQKKQLNIEELTSKQKLIDFSLSEYFEPFYKKLSSIQKIDLKEKLHSQILDLYIALENKLISSGKIPLSQLTIASDEVKNINQIETMMNTYSEKIMNVKEQLMLNLIDKDDAEEKIEYFKELRNKQVNNIKGD